MTPGERIRQLRLERDWTQKQLAAKVGNIDHSGVSNIELGAVPLGFRRAQRFAQALSVRVEEILPPEAERTTLGSVDLRLASIEAMLSGTREEAARGREALMAALAASEVRLARIEVTLASLAAQDQATRT